MQKALFKKAKGMKEDRRWSAGRMGRGRGVADGRQWKSTADSCNPRSLSQLDMIVMESPGQNPKEEIPSAAGRAALSASLKGCFTLYICIVLACCGE